MLKLKALPLVFLSYSLFGAPIEVDQLHFELFGAGEGVIDTETLKSHEFRFLSEDGIFFAPPADAKRDEVSIVSGTQLNNSKFSLEGLQSLQSQIVRLLNDQGFYGVLVVADPDQIDLRTGEDYREEAEQDLTLQIWLTEVVDVRTVGKGYRIKDKDPLNNPLHKSVIHRSPIKIAESETESPPAFIRKKKLENYLERLNRHPVRRVEAAISSAGQPGEVILDYLVYEAKPWVAYAQISNTGSESTGVWRERIGGAHYQLTGNDDILSFDFITAELDSANAFVGSYQIPIIKPDYLSLRVFGSYSDFEAQNLFVPNSQNFTGETITYGAELTYTPFYLWRHAIGFTVGGKMEDIEVENILGSTTGAAELTTGYFRVSAEKNKQHHRSYASIGWESNFNTNDTLELTSLGRLLTTDQYDLLTFDFQQSFFLEPLFKSYSRPDKDKWLSKALVHELAFSARGQWVLGDERMIPQKQLFAGGLFSARGYEESITAGDNGFVASAEYRFHLARLLKPASLLEDKEAEASIPGLGSFNFRAPDLYQQPDWNLILRGFVDYASLSINEIRPDEVENDLLSAGVGLELQLKSNLNIRVDYGHVLETASNVAGPIDNAEKGDSRIHVLATFSF